VAQQFNQGSLQFTQNSLDLAITGEGYFAMSDTISSQDFTFTRAGAFKLNKNNFVVDAQGNYLRGFPVDSANGNTTSVSLSTANPIQIPDASGAPRATNNIYSSFNLDAGAALPAVAPFNPDESATYNSSTSTTVYDSLGEPHIVQFFFVKGAGNNQWDVHATLDGQQFDDTGANGTTPISNFEFDSSGLPLTPVSQGNSTFDPVTLGAVNLSGLLSNGASFPNDVNINWRDEAGTPTKLPTQYSSRFEVKALEQDGATVGRLTGIDIGTDGKIVASYSNGDSTFVSQVSMVRFANSQGLSQAGNTSWKESLTSGEPIAGEPGSGTLGSINSSALEQSNVNLTNELVDLISAQRNFQANSRALEVNSTLQQNILQIR
jgi:flagellar hook protein FlgE